MSIGSVTSAPLSSQLLTLRSFANQQSARSQTATSPVRAAATNNALTAAAAAPLATQLQAINANGPGTPSPLSQNVRETVSQLNATSGPLSPLAREQLYSVSPSINQSPLYASFPYERINGFVSRAPLSNPNPAPSPLQTAQSDQAQQIRNQINLGNSISQTQLRNSLGVPAGA